MEKIKKKKYEILYVLPLVISIFLIWSNSLQNAEDSGERSERVTEIVNELLEPKRPVTENVIRKGAHLSEFALEGMCVVLALWGYGALRWTNAGNGMLAGVFTALIDEGIQITSVGRVSSVVDVWIDLAGFVSGAGLFLLFLLVIKRCRKLLTRRGGAKTQKSQKTFN